MFPVRAGLVAILIMSANAAHALAQDTVQWRRDYNQARDQASQSGLPILIEVGAAWCVPCRKMEATTFRDQRIVRVVNARFIPVKLDGDQDQELVKQLRVELFPTLILAQADGTVIRKLSGFQTAEQLLPPLNDAVALAAGRSSEARSGALELLAQAKRDQAARFDLACLERCFAIVREYPNTPEASEAARIIVAIRGDAQRLRVALGRLELLTGVPANPITQAKGDQ